METKVVSIEPKPSVKVRMKFVLIKQIMMKKVGKIIVSEARDDKEKFRFSFEILQLGPDCRDDIKIGDHPIFSEYVKFSGAKVIEKNEEGMITNLIVYEDDIIAIDNEPDLLDENIILNYGKN